MSQTTREILSHSMRTSPKVAAAAASRKGIKRGPLTDEARAKMSASKQVTPTDPRWQPLYEFYLDKLRSERALREHLDQVSDVSSAA